MLSKRILRWVHIASTAWFMLCIGSVLVLALREAKVSWWLIFSLSGHSALAVFLLISVYLFAFFRGVSDGNEIVEHPLTSSELYMMLYCMCPFLGLLAGVLVAYSYSRFSQFILTISMGTLAATFLVWVIVDPLIGVLELLFPTSRQHRIERLAKAKSLRQERKESRERLLSELLAKDEVSQRRREELLLPKAEILAELMMSSEVDFKAECEAVEIGVSAWIIGGLSCMQQLHSFAIERYNQRDPSMLVTDHIPVWWDGIGDWRNKSLM